MPALSKPTLRSTCKRQRQARSSVEQSDAAARVSAFILAWSPYREAKRIALYQAINGEINLDAVWQSAVAQNKSCYFPVIHEDQTLSFLPATPTTALNNNRFGIAEPCVSSEEALSPEQMDILFLPALAFDGQGTRLGMGGGYYDRTLAHHRPKLLIGIAYDVERQPFIEADAWDIPMDAVITERTIYWSHP